MVITPGEPVTYETSLFGGYVNSLLFLVPWTLFRKNNVFHVQVILPARVGYTFVALFVVLFVL